MKYNVLIILTIFILIKSKDEISKEYIDENFKIISQKENIKEYLIKIINNGDYDILKYYLKKLKENNINYDLYLEESIHKKIEKMINIFNQLKYEDEIGIKIVSPAFEWTEGNIQVVLKIKYSAMLNSFACPHVDDEKLIVLNDRKTIRYESRCLLSNYQMKFLLELKLYAEVENPDKLMSERGETIVNLKKINKVDWGRLLDIGYTLPDNSFKMY